MHSDLMWTSCHVPRGTISVVRFLNPHSLDIRKLANPVRSEFTAVSRVLYAAKGQAGIGRNHPVDEHHPCFNFIDEAFALVLVIRPGAGSQPEAAVVRDRNCLVHILGAKYRSHRSK